MISLINLVGVKMKKWVKDEKGSVTIEFVGIIPLLLLMVVIIMQFAMVANTKIAAESAAMEGARMAIVDGDHNAAARNTASKYHVESVTKAETIEGDHTYVTVKVTINAPLIHNNWFKTNHLTLPVSSEVTMRKE